MRFIHISDIHYSDNLDHQRVITALCHDLNTISKEGKVDAILCTGDLAHKGITDEVSVQKICTLLDRIRSAIDNSIPLIICPGNHDINLHARNALFQPIFDNVKTPECANKLVEESQTNNGVAGVLAHLDGFLNIARHANKKAYENHRLVHTYKLSTDSVSVGFAVLNSAWMTKGGGIQDYGHLFVGERQIDIALQQISDCEIKIAVMHHTLDWLFPAEKMSIHRSLAANFNALFCGHNHETNANNLVSNIGSLFTSNAGCIYQSREYFNGYTILDLDLVARKWITTAREYYSQRNEFDIAPRFSTGGQKEFPLQTHIATQGVIVPSTAMSNAQEKANSKLLSFSASEVAPKQIGAIFVEPPLGKVNEKNYVAREAIEKSGNNDLLSLRELTQTESDLLVIGKRESGKTTLLHHIVIDRFTEFHIGARIGFVIDISSLSKLTIPSALEQAVEFIGAELRRSDVIEILKTGSAVVGFDNVQLHNEVHTKLIQDFCTTYSQVRYIVAASEELLNEFSIETPPSFNRKQLPIYIHSFKSKQTRELICKWFGDQTQSLIAQQRLAWVNNLMTRLHVPRTPFLVSILLWVLEQKPTANLINQASAIEVLIDGLLDKLRESKARADYDSTIQAHFLSEFATKLDKDCIEWVTSLDFEDFVVNYFKRKGLKVSTRGFTEELLRKGLLYERSEQIAFKFDCFRAFFLARKFAEQGDSWRKAIDQTNIHRYTVELDLLTGLHRDRQDVLEAVRQLSLSLVKSANMDIEFSRLDQLGKDILPLNNELALESLEKEVLHETFDEQKRDEMVDMMETPTDVSLDHDAGRKRQGMGPSSVQLDFVAALRAFSIVLRNSELIDDVELKRACLDDALQLWSKLLIASLEWVAKMDLDSTELDNQEKTNVRLLMQLVVPQGIITIMSEALSTPKLETFIMEKVTDKETIIRSLSVFLAIDIVTKESITAAKKLLKDMEKNPLIVQILFFKLLSLYLFEAQSNSIKLLRDCLAEAFTVLRGSSRQNKAMLKGQFLNSLDKQRVKSQDAL